MPEYHIRFDSTHDTIQFPTQLLKRGRYRIGVEENDVSIYANKDGLLYLAEVFVRCALGEHSKGFHLHLPMSSDEKGPNVNMRPELTLHVSR